MITKPFIRKCGIFALSLGLVGLLLWGWVNITRVSAEVIHNDQQPEAAAEFDSIPGERYQPLHLSFNAHEAARDQWRDLFHSR